MQASQAITRRSASNLALGFLLLPKPRREGISALYAFCRQVDDVADEDVLPVDERRRQLAEWRADIQRASAGENAQFAVNRELAPVIARYQLPVDLFEEIIRGVEMDLDVNRYETYAELETYCYRVASAVGLLSIRVFGFRDGACHDYAVYLGKALQLTNILRDVHGDAERGRIYLPLQELARFHVSPEEILRGEYSERLHALASSVAGRTREFYRLARQTLPAVDRRSMVAAELMGSVYWRLLRKLEARRFDVFGGPAARLSKPHKLFLLLRTWCNLSSGLAAPNYGSP